MRTTFLALVLTCMTAACAGRPEQRHEVSQKEVPPPLELKSTAYEAALEVRLPDVPPQEYPGLHNVYRLSPSIISGGEPADAGALEQLAEWGVKTILSVDGKVPDVETAELLGMRYVHVPIQYSGIDEDEILRIAKTFRELEGPFYVHCYHGKHRGPAAAAVGRVCLDGVPRDQAIAEMRQWCATSSKYEGLYAAVAAARMPAAQETARHDFDFEAAHSFSGLRAGMIRMARKWDLVKDAQKRGWKADPAHPDVDPLQEATQLHQIFDQCDKLDDMKAWQDDFRGWMREGRQGSEKLLRALTDCSQDLAPEVQWMAAANGAYEQISQACASCHAAYRD